MEQVLYPYSMHNGLMGSLKNTQIKGQAAFRGFGMMVRGLLQEEGES